MQKLPIFPLDYNGPTLVKPNTKVANKGSCIKFVGEEAGVFFKFFQTKFLAQRTIQLRFSLSSNFFEKDHMAALIRFSILFNPLSTNPEKWSNTLKQIVGNLPTICLSVLDHFMNLALKGLRLAFVQTNKCSQ